MCYNEKHMFLSVPEQLQKCSGALNKCSGAVSKSSGSLKVFRSSYKSSVALVY